MAKALYTALVLVILTVCGCGGSSTKYPAVLTAISVVPSSVTLAPGTSTSFRATGYFSDGGIVDITDNVTWSSANTGVGTVNSQGVVTAANVGSTSITASSAGVSGSATLTTAQVVAITVAPVNPLLVTGTSVQLKARATLTGGLTQDISNVASWTSSDNTIATVSPSGLVTGVSAGTVTVTAALGSAVGSTPVTVANIVSIALTPVNPSVPVGTTQQFVASGTLSNGATKDVSTLVNWISANTAVATISATGLATTLVPGSTTVSASYPGIPAQTSTLTVQGPASITVTPNNPTAVLGSNLQLTATGTFADGSTRDVTNLVNWTSANNSVATVSNAAGSIGLLSPVGTGSTQITATMPGSTGAPISQQSTVTVKALAGNGLSITPANTSVAVGSTVQLTAKASFTDGGSSNVTESATWTSSAPAIASVSDAAGSKGLVSGNALGSATITAKAGSTTTTTLVTVTNGSVPTTPQNRAFVSNFEIGTVSVIDTTTNTVITTIPVGTGPQGIAISPATNRAYVANSTAGTVSVIDIINNVVVNTISVGGGPWDVALDPSRNRAYVTNSTSNSVSVIDTTNNLPLTNIPVGTNPRGIAINPGTNRVYVANFGANTVWVIDTAGNAVIDSIGVGSAPVDVAVNASANKILVANNFSQFLSVIDTTSNALSTNVPVGSGAQVVAVNPSSNRAYVTLSSSNTLAIIDTLNNNVLATIGTGAGPRGVAVKAATNRLYVVNNGSNDVWVFDTTNSNSLAAPIAKITGFSAPTYIAVVP